MSTNRKTKKKQYGLKTKYKIFLFLIAVFMLFIFVTGIDFFSANTGNFSTGAYFYIRTGSKYDDVKQTLQKGGFVKNIKTFDFLARQAHYPDMVKAGKYHITKGMSNFNILRMLRSGKQTPVKLVINKLRTKTDFIQYLSSNLEADSLVLKSMLQDEVYLSQFGLDTNNVMCAILPDTYEMWWNTTADKAFRKIEQYYVKFWTDDRKEKAAAKGLTPNQVIILASIIEEETNYNPEKPFIASTYINRLNKKMKLQADPTAKFAVGDFMIRRVTSAITGLASPYNTYYTLGLPPGPICTPSRKSIEAVLNAPKTDYLYFCAKEDFSGTHRFASTLEEHQKNARRYQQALNARGIH